MSEFESRRKSLEEKFFAEFDKELIDEIQSEKEKALSIDELKRATGYSNESLLDSLHKIGLTPSSLTSLKFIPLIRIAWADDSIEEGERIAILSYCLLYTSPSPRDATLSRMPSSA